MDISKINRSQHENRNFHIFGINIKAQSEFSHMNSLIPFFNPWTLSQRAIVNPSSTRQCQVKGPSL